MIRIAPGAAPLDPIERFAFDVLVDASRLLVTDDPGSDAVRLTVTGPAGDADPAALAGPAVLSRAAGEVGVARSALRAVGMLAGAAAEQGTTARDRHDRVPSSAHPLVRAGRERVPVVSELGAALRAAVAAVAGRRPVRLLAPWPGGRRWAAALTHDLDVAAAWPVFTALRAAELARSGRLGDVARVLGAAAAAVGRDPVWAGVATTLRADAARGVAATWFVISGTPTWSTWRRGDVTYRPESRRVRRIIARVAAEGHEIGLHGSFATIEDQARFAQERARLAALAGRPAAGVRQHFLRFRPGRTQRLMAAAGFTYDASYGFPDRNGFRLGTADVVPGWDAEAGAPSPLSEVPLTWMDRALSKYRGLQSPAAWVDDALDLAQTCRRAEGLWVGLWHPNLTPALGYPGAPDAYASLLERLAAGEPHLDTLGSLVAWRAARRAARAVAMRADGSVEVAAAPGPWPLTIEDERGRPAPGVVVAPARPAT